LNEHLFKEALQLHTQGWRTTKINFGVELKNIGYITRNYETCEAKDWVKKDVYRLMVQLEKTCI